MEKKVLTENHIKSYFQKKKKEKPMLKYASFNFLIYLAKVMDIDTAVNISKQVVDENIDSEVLDSIIESILPYN